MPFSRIQTLAGMYLAVLLAAMGNHYLEWQLTGSVSRQILAVVQFVGIVLIARYGSHVMTVMDARNTELRRAEEAAESARDKSNDAAETERLRKAIGLPPTEQLQRKRGDASASNDE